MEYLLPQIKLRPRNRHRRCFAFAALLAWAIPSMLSAATFTASLDRDRVVVGDSATLTLTFEGGQPRSVANPPAVPNLQIISAGTSQNVSMINGQTSVTFSQSFLVTPMQPGEYTIPALQVDVGGQILTSRPLNLKAVKSSAPAANDSGERLAFLRMLIPKKEICLGEVIEAQLQLFIRDGVANADGILQSFERLGGSPFKAEGFSSLKTACGQRQRVQVGNGIYDAATLVTSLSPVKTGSLTIDSISATLTLQLQAEGQRGGYFGLFPRFQERRVPVATDAEAVTVLPLPPDPPAGFNGAVGSYTLAVTAGPTNVSVGDPITVKIQISGSGALESLTLPDQPAWNQFKTYPPTSKLETSDPLGVTGVRTFEEIIVPQNSDIKALPPVSFIYFDCDKKAFQTLNAPAIALTVRPGGNTAVPVTAAANRAADNNPPPAQDIVPIKQRPGDITQVSPPLVRQPWFLALQTVPVLALVSAAGWRKRSEMLANNPRLRRRRLVAQLIRAGLGDLRKFAAENNSEQFFAALFRLLQEQLGERLDLPASAITEAVIEEHLRPRGAPESILAPLHDLFQSCNLARYAPVNTSQELAATASQLESVLAELRELKV